VKGLPSDLLSAMQADSADVKIAVRIGYSSPACYCSGADPVVIGGEPYEPRWLRVTGLPVEMGRAPNLRIEIDNRDGVPGSAALSEGLAGATVTVHWLVRPEGAAWSQPHQVLSAPARRVRVTSKVIAFEVSPEPDRRRRLGLMTAARTCGAVFKGRLCGYAGSEGWCDHTFARCSSLGNTERFLGFRWAPDPGTVIPLARSAVSVAGGPAPHSPPPFAPPPLMGPTVRRRIMAAVRVVRR